MRKWFDDFSDLLAKEDGSFSSATWTNHSFFTGKGHKNVLAAFTSDPGHAILRNAALQVSVNPPRDLFPQIPIVLLKLEAISCVISIPF